MTFASRIATAQKAEAEIADRARELGWTVGSFGQGQLDDEMRESLRHTNSLLRWLPDLLATRDSVVRFIEVKVDGRGRSTGNNDIEIKSIEAQEALEAIGFGAECWTVWTDGTCQTPVILRKYGWEGRWQGNGSGTPFLLIRKADCALFEDIFA